MNEENFEVRTHSKAVSEYHIKRIAIELQRLDKIADDPTTPQLELRLTHAVIDVINWVIKKQECEPPTVIIQDTVRLLAMEIESGLIKLPKIFADSKFIDEEDDLGIE